MHIPSITNEYQEEDCLIVIVLARLITRSNNRSTSMNYFLEEVLVPFSFSICMQQGWSYVGDRLLSAVIPYEETGWYDGQMWVKPPEVSSLFPLLKVTFRLRNQSDSKIDCLLKRKAFRSRLT